MKLKLLLSTISILSGLAAGFYLIYTWYQLVIKDVDISILFNNNLLIKIFLLMFLQRLTLDLRKRLDKNNDKL